MKIAIVDDEPENARQLQEHLRRFSEERNYRMNAFHYASGLELLNSFAGQFDIIMMDISMPYLDGMETARKIREVDSQVLIIFVTNLAQYAIRGYEVDALDFLVKPVSYFTFSQRLERAVARIQDRSRSFLVINHKTGPKKLDVGSIYYIESSGHRLIYHTKSGDYTVFGNLKDAQRKLEQEHFVSCSKGYLVSLRHVDGIENGCAMVNGTSLVISRTRKNAFMEALTDYFGGIML